MALPASIDYCSKDLATVLGSCRHLTAQQAIIRWGGNKYAAPENLFEQRDHHR